ncbi:precorrin-3B synthase [Paraburkholderia sp. CNPSo 3274]|uniref:precorrin-3B synthase n=1 Tax=Paraburkholderia sp. CNPSo 3274 TaxID=2940932 RepID=UPI0020B8FDE6|nr:precorrin-3B synthase [Paraburkholderia sp. CNPSo 3274]MCP3705712.1 precorrin-3B synthase [Paraburkholderia sp. CNPSo 3274]
MKHETKPVSPAAALAVLRPSACPGLVRVVAARDGALCRIRLPGGVLSAARARALADAALTHASGVLELTNRANLQIRGVRAGEEAALSATLIGAGLGPAGIDVASPVERACAADELRNVMLSPLAGLDPNALCDTTALAATLIDMMQREPRFATLSPKFALQLDGGERVAMLEHPHDIWLAALPHGATVRFAVGLAGCPTTHPIGTLAAGDVCASMRALLHAFLDLAGVDATRMRDVLAAHSLDALLQRAQQHGDFALMRDNAALHAWRRAASPADLRLGAHALHADGSGYVGAQPALGRIDAQTLRALAALAEDSSDATLRVTPWQGVLLPNVPAHAMAAALERLHALGLVVSRTNPLARLIACTGSTGCAKSHADTKADARRLAALLPPDAEAHLSGCERSCAAAHCAPFTLLASAPDHYDLYQRDDTQSGFGQLVARNLTIEAAALALAQRPRSTQDV